MAAALVLSEWPIHFFELLSTLGMRSFSKPVDIRRQFAPLYSSLFRRRITTCDDDIDFLREAFLEFVCNRWDGRCADPKTLRRVSSRVHRGFVTRTELARLLGVDARTLKRHSELESKPNAIEPILRASKSLSEYPSPSPSKEIVMRIRQAAREIGLPVEVLRLLKSSGVFEVKHQLRLKPGFHQADVRHFRQRFVDLKTGGPALNQGENVSSVGEALSQACWSINERAALIGSLLRRDVRVVGPTVGLVSNLRILEGDLEIFLQRERPGSGVFMTSQQVGRLLECGPTTASALCLSGYLKGRKSGRGWQVARESVLEFQRQFVKLSEIASSLATSSRRLVRICSEYQIRLYCVGAGTETRRFLERSAIPDVETGYLRRARDA
jgi:hypothetical protein